jgi:hypothetical protein
MPKDRAETGGGINWALRFIGHPSVIGQEGTKFKLQKEGRRACGEFRLCRVSLSWKGFWLRNPLSIGHRKFIICHL